MLANGIADGSDSEESACNVGDQGLIPGSGKSPGEGNGNPLQYPGLENSMDREAWWATVHGVAMSRTRLCNEHFDMLANTFKLFNCNTWQLPTSSEPQRSGNNTKFRVQEGIRDKCKPSWWKSLKPSKVRD